MTIEATTETKERPKSTKEKNDKDQIEQSDGSESLKETLMISLLLKDRKRNAIYIRINVIQILRVYLSQLP